MPPDTSHSGRFDELSLGIDLELAEGVGNFWAFGSQWAQLEEPSLGGGA